MALVRQRAIEAWRGGGVFWGSGLASQPSRYRKATAASTQQARYQDMAFRIFRNDALSKYRDSFDLAARYYLPRRDILCGDWTIARPVRVDTT